MNSSKKLLFAFSLLFATQYAQAQFKTPTGNVAGTSSTGFFEFQHNTSQGGLKLIRNSGSTMKSQIAFFQQSTEKWSLGIDQTENNTNSFFIYGGDNAANRFSIAPTGKIGINNSNPQHLLHLLGGGIWLTEVNGSTLDNDGPGADLVLQDKTGGILDIYTDNKVAGIALGGGSQRLSICQWAGHVVIGNPTVPVSNNYNLYVSKGILTEKLKIALASDAVNWSDFVFAKDYKLMPLSEVEKYVKANKHLPEIPSADEVYKEGLDVAQMDAKLLQKIEELTLYMIELEKQNKQLEKRLNDLEKKSK